MQIKDYPIQCHLVSHGAGPDLHAIGATESLVLHESAGAWLAAQQFLDKQAGKSVFAAFSYELKNDIEALHSENPAYIPFPAMTLFVPRVLVTWELGELEVIELNDRSIDLTSLLPLIANLHTSAHVPEKEVVISSLAKGRYLSRLQSLQAHIQAGDIYEVNYCQEFKLSDLDMDPWACFQSLVERTQAPYSCHLRIEGIHLMSGSPELFLEKDGATIRSKPIKGTRKRSADPAEDERLREELQHDLKERGENIMICDLVRNDLSRTALSGSVEVKELCEVYSYPTVHQMISTIESKVAPETLPLDVIRSAFPMGSMTGAPKVRAMELIESHEDFRRGIYSGAVGFFTPSRDFTFNVIIRSILYNAETKRASVGAGGAITALSDPELEYEESLLKAKAMLEVLGA